jgi:threonine dehydratase
MTTDPELVEGRAEPATSLSLADVFRARRRIAPFVRRTPCIRSTWLSDAAQTDVSLKLESLQLSNSFKARGAFNAVVARLERGTTAPSQLVTASAGNHGRGLAAAAEAFQLPLIVFTPADAPRTKLAAIERHGATLRAEGRDYDHAERMAMDYAARTGAEFISPYNDRDVIAGAATVALEIIEDMPAVDMFVVPIGGGGLISGVASVAKAIAPACRVVGVEVEASCPFQTGLRAGRLVEIVPGDTLADGLGGNPDPQTITFGFIQRLVDEIVTVSEEHLRTTMVGLIEFEHLIAEGAGAAAAAALVGQSIRATGQRIAVIVSGANVDAARVASLLHT